LFKKNNLGELVGKLETLAGEGGYRRVLGEGARRVFEEKFSARTMVEKIDLLYRRLLDTP
jgi:glycosyltransferase involved in cell wall biosynthesis